MFFVGSVLMVLGFLVGVVSILEAFSDDGDSAAGAAGIIMAFMLLLAGGGMTS